MTGRFPQIAIIGAGIAGITCARRLASAGLQPKLFDKGRRPGGRLASREIGTADGQRFVDHGAQYFTARGAAFAEEVAALVQQNVLTPWSARATVRSGDSRHVMPGDARFSGRPCMNAWPAHLARALNVQTKTEIKAVVPCGQGYKLTLEDGSLTPEFDAVVLAVPAPQSAHLLEIPAPDLAVSSATAQLAPCWAVWCALPSRPAPLFDALRVEGDDRIAWIARQPGQPDDVEALWLVHASAAWSRAHLEDDGAEVANALITVLQAELEVDARPRLVQAHRWRHALVQRALETPCQWDAERRLGTCGDWHLGPRVELAWQSGHALAEEMLATLSAAS